jgi:hypothetical protein
MSGSADRVRIQSAGTFGLMRENIAPSLHGFFKR